MSEKSTECFKSLIADQTRQTKPWTKITNISDEAQEESYAVAETVPKREIPYNCGVNNFTSMM
jgi:hypothetical protein